MGAGAGGAGALARQQMMAAAMRKMQGNIGQRQSLFQKPTSGETSLVGDRQLPTENRTITPIPNVRGGFDVSYGGNSVGQLLRGGNNGRFSPNGNNIPSVLQQPQGPPPGSAQGQPSPPPGMPMQLGGGGGGMPGQRQYAPNPFQQQQMQAQMLRRPIAMNVPPPTGGFQGG